MRAALIKEPESGDAYAQLAMAYGRKGDLADADLASAQAAFARGDNKTARELAARAKMRFPVGSPGWVRADDIVAFNKNGQKPASYRSVNAKRTIAMTLIPRIAISIAAAMLAGACRRAAPAPAQSFSADQRHEIESIIKDYLLAHPEVLQDVMAELEKRQQEADAEKHRAAVVREQRHPVQFAPPGRARQSARQRHDGRVLRLQLRLTASARMPDMLELLKTDPNLKFVLKEFPVLGEGSVEAAHVAVAARMQDPTGKKYIEFHQKLLGGRGAADKARALAVAKEVGFDMARI